MSGQATTRSEAGREAAGREEAGRVAAARVARLVEVAPMVQRICTARLGPVDGQDAAQEVLEAVWRAQQRPGFADGSVHGYAAATARYQVLRGYAERDRADVPAGDLAGLVWPDLGPGPAEQVERAETAAEAGRRVAELLVGLSPRERQVLVASELGSRPTGETAAELGIGPSGVRSAQVRAMARMREQLDVASPNPLAAPVTEQERSRRAAADRSAARAEEHGCPARGPGGAPLPREVHEAGRAAAAAGGSARELAAAFGVSESTATRWHRAVHTDADVDEVPADPLERARRAVSALPALEQARAMTAERGQLDRPPAGHDLHHDAAHDVEQNHGQGAEHGADDDPADQLAQRGGREVSAA